MIERARNTREAKALILDILGDNPEAAIGLHEYLDSLEADENGD